MPDAESIQLDVDRFTEPNELPDVIVEILDKTPFIVGGEGQSELQLIQSGYCVCCHKPLGRNTMLVLDTSGISSIVCSGVCHDDLMILGYLNEQGQDILQRVEMRRQLNDGGHD